MKSKNSDAALHPRAGADSAKAGHGVGAGDPSLRGRPRLVLRVFLRVFQQERQRAWPARHCHLSRRPRQRRCLHICASHLWKANTAKQTLRLGLRSLVFLRTVGSDDKKAVIMTLGR